MAVAVVGLAACKGEAPKAAPPPREVEVLAVTAREARETGEYLGTLESRQSVNVVAQVGGYVRKIHVKPGQTVDAGQPLIEVDARQESAALESAQAQQQSAGSSLELAQRTLARTQSLYQEGLVSAQELERAQAGVEAARASSQSAAAAVSQRRVQLQYFAVQAPFGGTLGDVLVRVGDLVTGSTPLMSVAQAQVLEVSVAVPAERARVVEREMPMELLDSAGKVILTCPVYFVGPQADPRTQLVEVKGAFQNTAGLRPNERVRTRLVYGVRQALQVPALAVTRQSGQTFVFAVTEKDGKTTVARKPVTLGALGPQSYVVEAGLKEGDRIAVSGLQALRDGAAIKPIVKTPAAAPPAPANPEARN